MFRLLPLAPATLPAIPRRQLCLLAFLLVIALVTLSARFYLMRKYPICLLFHQCTANICDLGNSRLGTMNPLLALWFAMLLRWSFVRQLVLCWRGRTRDAIGSMDPQAFLMGLKMSPRGITKTSGTSCNSSTWNRQRGRWQYLLSIGISCDDD